MEYFCSLALFSVLLTPATANRAGYVDALRIVPAVSPTDVFLRLPTELSSAQIDYTAWVTSYLSLGYEVPAVFELSQDALAAALMRSDVLLQASAIEVDAQVRLAVGAHNLLNLTAQDLEFEEGCELMVSQLALSSQSPVLLPTIATTDLTVQGEQDITQGEYSFLEVTGHASFASRRGGVDLRKVSNVFQTVSALTGGSLTVHSSTSWGLTRASVGTSLTVSSRADFGLGHAADASNSIQAASRLEVHAAGSVTITQQVVVENGPILIEAGLNIQLADASSLAVSGSGYVLVRAVQGDVHMAPSARVWSVSGAVHLDALNGQISLSSLQSGKPMQPSSSLDAPVPCRDGLGLETALTLSSASVWPESWSLATLSADWPFALSVRAGAAVVASAATTSFSPHLSAPVGWAQLIAGLGTSSPVSLKVARLTATSSHGSLLLETQDELELAGVEAPEGGVTVHGRSSLAVLRCDASSDFGEEAAVSVAGPLVLATPANLTLHGPAQASAAGADVVLSAGQYLLQGAEGAVRGAANVQLTAAKDIGLAGGVNAVGKIAVVAGLRLLLDSRLQTLHAWSQASPCVTLRAESLTTGSSSVLHVDARQGMLQLELDDAVDPAAAAAAEQEQAQEQPAELRTRVAYLSLDLGTNDKTSSSPSPMALIVRNAEQSLSLERLDMGAGRSSLLVESTQDLVVQALVTVPSGASLSLKSRAGSLHLISQLKVQGGGSRIALHGSLGVYQALSKTSGLISIDDDATADRTFQLLVDSDHGDVRLVSPHNSLGPACALGIRAFGRARLDSSEPTKVRLGGGSRVQGWLELHFRGAQSMLVSDFFGRSSTDRPQTASETDVQPTWIGGGFQVNMTGPQSLVHLTNLDSKGPMRLFLTGSDSHVALVNHHPDGLDLAEVHVTGNAAFRTSDNLLQSGPVVVGGTAQLETVGPGRLDFTSPGIQLTGRLLLSTMGESGSSGSGNSQQDVDVRPGSARLKILNPAGLLFGCVSGWALRDREAADATAPSSSFSSFASTVQGDLWLQLPAQSRLIQDACADGDDTSALAVVGRVDLHVPQGEVLLDQAENAFGSIWIQAAVARLLVHGQPQYGADLCLPAGLRQHALWEVADAFLAIGRGQSGSTTGDSTTEEGGNEPTGMGNQRVVLASADSGVDAAASPVRVQETPFPSRTSWEVQGCDRVLLKLFQVFEKSRSSAEETAEETAKETAGQGSTSLPSPCGLRVTAKLRGVAEGEVWGLGETRLGTSHTGQLSLGLEAAGGTGLGATTADTTAQFPATAETTAQFQVWQECQAAAEASQSGDGPVATVELPVVVRPCTDPCHSVQMKAKAGTLPGTVALIRTDPTSLEELEMEVRWWGVRELGRVVPHPASGAKPPATSTNTHSTPAQDEPVLLEVGAHGHTPHLFPDLHWQSLDTASEHDSPQSKHKILRRAVRGGLSVLELTLTAQLPGSATSLSFSASVFCEAGQLALPQAGSRGAVVPVSRHTVLLEWTMQDWVWCSAPLPAPPAVAPNAAYLPGQNKQAPPPPPPPLPPTAWDMIPPYYAQSSAEPSSLDNNNNNMYNKPLQTDTPLTSSLPLDQPATCSEAHLGANRQVCELCPTAANKEAKSTWYEQGQGLALGLELKLQEIRRQKKHLDQQQESHPILVKPEQASLEMAEGAVRLALFPSAPPAGVHGPETGNQGKQLRLSVNDAKPDLVEVVLARPVPDAAVPVTGGAAGTLLAGLVNFVARDGGWSAWSPCPPDSEQQQQASSSSSTSSSGEILQRRRTCSKPWPVLGGRACDGPAVLSCEVPAPPFAPGATNHTTAQSMATGKTSHQRNNADRAFGEVSQLGELLMSWLLGIAATMVVVCALAWVCVRRVEMRKAAERASSNDNDNDNDTPRKSSWGVHESLWNTVGRWTRSRTFRTFSPPRAYSPPVAAASSSSSSTYAFAAPADLDAMSNNSNNNSNNRNNLNETQQPKSAWDTPLTRKNSTKNRNDLLSSAGRWSSVKKEFTPVPRRQNSNGNKPARATLVGRFLQATAGLTGQQREKEKEVEKGQTQRPKWQLMTPRMPPSSESKREMLDDISLSPFNASIVRHEEEPEEGAVEGGMFTCILEDAVNGDGPADSSATHTINEDNDIDDVRTPFRTPQPGSSNDDDGWQRFYDESEGGSYYYYNYKTGEASWSSPRGVRFHDQQLLEQQQGGQQ